MTSVFDVIRKPLLTEKNQGLRDKNIQVFEVAAWANKHQIQEAVELLLQAKVKKIRTVNLPLQTKRLGRFVGVSGKRKKAYVELAEAIKAESN
ncbi:MAG: ribosomal protein [Acidobacteriota bacterium]|jgi:large subunit ribosomal protein L23|nr:50S ribosomal protein L23 [Acidobacteriota bacterium]